MDRDQSDSKDTSKSNHKYDSDESDESESETSKDNTAPATKSVFCDDCKHMYPRRWNFKKHKVTGACVS